MRLRDMVSYKKINRNGIPNFGIPPKKRIVMNGAEKLPWNRYYKKEKYKRQ